MGIRDRRVSRPSGADPSTGTGATACGCNQGAAVYRSQARVPTTQAGLASERQYRSPHHDQSGLGANLQTTAGRGTSGSDHDRCWPHGWTRTWNTRSPSTCRSECPGAHTLRPGDYGDISGGNVWQSARQFRDAGVPAELVQLCSNGEPPTPIAQRVFNTDTALAARIGAPGYVFRFSPRCQVFERPNPLRFRVLALRHTLPLSFVRNHTRTCSERGDQATRMRSFRGSCESHHAFAPSALEMKRPTGSLNLSLNLRTCSTVRFL